MVLTPSLYYRQILSANGIVEVGVVGDFVSSSTASSVHILPSFGIGKGELVWTDTDDMAICSVKVGNAIGQDAFEKPVDFRKYSNAVEKRTWKGSERVEEEVVDDAQNDVH